MQCHALWPRFVQCSGTRIVAVCLIAYHYIYTLFLDVAQEVLPETFLFSLYFLIYLISNVEEPSHVLDFVCCRYTSTLRCNGCRCACDQATFILLFFSLVSCSPFSSSSLIIIKVGLFEFFWDGCWCDILSALSARWSTMSTLSESFN